MKYLRSAGIRIIVSLFAGAFLSELIHIMTGDPNRPRTSSMTLICAIVIFVILTIVVRRSKD